MPTHIYNKNDEKINILKYIFEDKTLWFSNPLNFNDPFELKPHIEKIVNDEKHILLDSFSHHINQANEFHYSTVKAILNNIGILSLSENKEHLAMWAHYANNHKGIVIEFDKKHWFFTKMKLPKYATVIHNLRKVNYVLKNGRKSINSNEYFEDKDTYLTKSCDWEYEKEYRMTVYVETNDEYIDGIGIKFPTELIKSVYIGSKAEKETIKYIKNLKLCDEWKHIDIYKMEIDKKNYKLVSKALIIKDDIQHFGMNDDI